MKHPTEKNMTVTIKDNVVVGRSLYGTRTYTLGQQRPHKNKAGIKATMIRIIDAEFGLVRTTTGAEGAKRITQFLNDYVPLVRYEEDIEATPPAAKDRRSNETVLLLREIRDELRTLRKLWSAPPAAKEPLEAEAVNGVAS